MDVYNSEITKYLFLLMTDSDRNLFLSVHLVDSQENILRENSGQFKFSSRHNFCECTAYHIYFL